MPAILSTRPPRPPRHGPHHQREELSHEKESHAGQDPGGETRQDAAQLAETRASGVASRSPRWIRIRAAKWISFRAAAAKASGEPKNSLHPAELTTLPASDPTRTVPSAASARTIRNTRPNPSSTRTCLAGS